MDSMRLREGNDVGSSGSTVVGTGTGETIAVDTIHQIPFQDAIWSRVITDENTAVPR